MKVHRTGLLFRVGFMFVPRENEPVQIDRCTLITRFCLWLLPWLALNLVVWIIFGLILGILAQIIWRTLLFVGVGKKLAYQHDSSVEWVIGVRALSRLCVLSYKTENIRFFNFLDGIMGEDFPRSPLLFLIFLLFGAGFLYLIAISTPDIFAFLFGKVASAGSIAYGTIGWWGSAILALIGVVLFARLYQGVKRKIVATESGKILASHLKELKSAHCPIYEVVQ